MADVKKPLGPVYAMADVIANVVDVNTTVLQLEHNNCGWCYCYLLIEWLADVIANVADVIATSVLADDIAMVVDVKTTQGDWCFGRC